MVRFWTQFSLGCVVGLLLVAFTAVQAGRHGLIQAMSLMDLGRTGLEMAAMVIAISGVFAWARVVADGPGGEEA